MPKREDRPRFEYFKDTFQIKWQIFCYYITFAARARYTVRDHLKYTNKYTFGSSREYESMVVLFRKTL